MNRRHLRQPEPPVTDVLQHAAVPQLVERALPARRQSTTCAPRVRDPASSPIPVCARTARWVLRARREPAWRGGCLLSSERPPAGDQLQDASQRGSQLHQSTVDAPVVQLTCNRRLRSTRPSRCGIALSAVVEQLARKQLPSAASARSVVGCGGLREWYHTEPYPPSARPPRRPSAGQHPPRTESPRSSYEVQSRSSPGPRIARCKNTFTESDKASSSAKTKKAKTMPTMQATPHESDAPGWCSDLLFKMPAEMVARVRTSDCLTIESDLCSHELMTENSEKDDRGLIAVLEDDLKYKTPMPSRASGRSTSPARRSHAELPAL